MRRWRSCLAIVLVLVLVLACGAPALAVDIDVGGGDFDYPTVTPTPPGGGDTVVTYYDITVAETSNGTATASATRAPSGQTITITVDPDEGYRTGSVVVTPDSGVAQVTVTAQGNGRYTFTMPASDVTVTVTYIRGMSPDDTGVSDWLITEDHIAYLGGYPDGTFDPGLNMRRAEAAQMFYNLLLNKDVPITVSFVDVDEDAWYARAVNVLASLGIIDGVGGNRFDPERQITRAEFTVMAMRFADLEVEGENIFTDLEEGAWYYEAVVDAVQYGWIGGYPDGTFRPDANITRAEVTTIVNRMLGRSADEDYVDAHRASLTQFSDLAVSHWAYYEIVEATNDHDYTQTADGETWIALS